MHSAMRANVGAGLAVILSQCLGGCDRLKPKDAGKVQAEAKREQAACASPSANEKLKGLIFDEAISQRRADRATLDTLADYSVARMEEPVVKGWDPALDVTRCEARFILDVPPGAERAFAGERRLQADIDYTAQASADGSGLVYRAKGAEPIVNKLAQFNLDPVAYRPPPAIDEPQQPAPTGQSYYPPQHASIPGPSQSAPEASRPRAAAPPKSVPSVRTADLNHNASKQAPAFGSPRTSAEATVRAFYRALENADGAAASSQIIPEKRSTSAFSPEGISRFYGRLPEPLRLTSIEPTAGGAFHVTYRYSAGRSRCNGSALVKVTERGGREYIGSIQSLSGC